MNKEEIEQRLKELKQEKKQLKKQLKELPKIVYLNGYYTKIQLTDIINNRFNDER